MIGMFEMMAQKITPCIEDEEAKIQLENYKSSSMELVQ
jgi:hypothetical protein